MIWVRVWGSGDRDVRLEAVYQCWGSVLKLMGGLLGVMSEWKRGWYFRLLEGLGVLVFMWRWRPLQSDALSGCQQVVGEHRVN